MLASTRVWVAALAALSSGRYAVARLRGFDASLRNRACVAA